MRLRFWGSALEYQENSALSAGTMAEAVWFTKPLLYR